MKTLILYSTKTGTTAKCADLLSRELRDDVTVCDISGEIPTISDFDLVIFGTYIRMGRIDKKMYSFLIGALASCKKYALYICAGYDEKTDDYFKKCFPRGAAEGAVLRASFGGELKLDRQKGIDKLITKLLLEANADNDDFVMPTIFREEIGRFADKLREMK